jgi:hypothetical protein
MAIPAATNMREQPNRKAMTPNQVPSTRASAPPQAPVTVTCITCPDHILVSSDKTPNRKIKKESLAETKLAHRWPRDSSRLITYHFLLARTVPPLLGRSCRGSNLCDDAMARQTSTTSTSTKITASTWGVPGFPIESILARLLGGLIASTVIRRR